MSSFRIRCQIQHYDLKHKGCWVPLRKISTKRLKFSLWHMNSGPQKGKIWFQHFHTGIFCANVHKSPKEENGGKSKDVKATKQTSKLSQKSGPSFPQTIPPSFEDMKHKNYKSDYKCRKKAHSFVHQHDMHTIQNHRSRGKLLICPSSSISLPFILYAILMRMTRDFWK